MKKIEKLTDTQIARFPEFVKKWTDIGLCTEPSDRLQAEHGIRLAYAAANLQAPVKIVWTSSPLAQGLARALVVSGNGASVWASVRDSVWASVWDSVGDSVRDSVGDSGYGQNDASWLAFYDYFREVCGLNNETEKLDGLMLQAQSAGWFLPHEHICWISERHRRVCRNSRGQLHSHDGMAVEYPDGWGVWAWNGVRVTEQIIMNPDSLMPEQIAKESNAQVRQVMVERIGIERICQLFKAQSADKRGTYELLILDLGDGRKRPYLKMLNPSIGVWHVEGVDPRVRTVQEALNFRNGLTPEQIDEINGADWYQQGDVILRPQGRTTFKSQPIQLT